MHLEDDQSLETVAYNTRMFRRTLTRLLPYVKDTGEVHYTPAMWNTLTDSFLKCPDLRSAVLFAIEQGPEAFLDEDSDSVTNLHQLPGDDLSISQSSVSRIMSATGLTRKEIETAFIPRNNLELARWVLDQWDIPLRARVYVYEAHCCGRSANRK